MDRRRFLSAFLAVAAGAALPARAKEFIAENKALSDVDFREKAIIELMQLRIANMEAAMKRAFEEHLYSQGTQ